MALRRSTVFLVAAACSWAFAGLASPAEGESVPWFRDGRITPRSEEWGSYDVLLNHPDMREAFERLGFDPDSTSRHASHFDLGNALYLAQLRARDDEKAWFRRADELFVWITLRGDCLHRRWGLPDTLAADEMEDLVTILRTVLPGLAELEVPPCDGGAGK